MTLIRSLLVALALVALALTGRAPALAQSDAQPGQLSPPPVIVSPSQPVPNVTTNPAPNSVPGSLSGLAPNAAPAAPAAPTAPAAAPAPELERLLQTLENDADRQRLVDTLRSLLQAQRQAQPQPAQPQQAQPQPAQPPQAQPESDLPDRVAGRVIDAVAEQIGGIGAAILRAASFIADAPKLWQGLSAIVANPLTRQRVVETTRDLVVILAVAWAAEWLIGLALRRARQRHELGARKGGWRRWRDSLLHMLLAILPVAGFGIIAYAALALLAPSFVVALIAVAMINAGLQARAIGVVSWMVLAPRVPQLRLLPVADETAAYFHV